MVVVVEGDETRTGQCPPGDRPGVQNEHDSREAHPRRGLVAGVVDPLRSRNTRFVSLGRYGFYGV